MSEPGCAFCGRSLAGMRSHAVYCSRRCKTKASDRRRREDGREVKRNHARYAGEAERRREQARVWAARNPEAGRLIRRRRKVRQRGSASRRITVRDWQRMILAYRGRCAYCGSDGPLHMDHVIPLARGGRHAIGNVVPACAPCNMSKHSSLVVEWRARLAKGVISYFHPSSSSVDAGCGAAA